MYRKQSLSRGLAKIWASLLKISPQTYNFSKCVTLSQFWQPRGVPKL
jgi:hypothetical protein